MRCVNAGCGAALEQGSLFCTSCGSAQGNSSAPSSGAAKTSNAQTPEIAIASQTVAQSESSASVSVEGDLLVMRAGEQIWGFTETEGAVLPGKRRPTIVMDEQVTHLAHTDRQLNMSDLYRRVVDAISSYEVPVDVKLVKARWINDEKEVRERIVASLRGHVFHDIKVIFGLDYLGRWANVHVSIGMEPSQVEREPEFVMPQDANIALIGGGSAIALGLLMQNGLVAMGGAAAMAYGFWRYKSAKAEHVFGLASKQAKLALKRLAERQSRTYKIDDMHLFCTAMKAVYQAVVDDIVESGAQVVRVTGGRGGYFADVGGTATVQGAKVSDAAELEV